MVIAFWNFFNQTIHLLNPNTAVTCTRGHFNQVVCMGLLLFAASKTKAFQTVLWMSEVLHQQDYSICYSRMSSLVPKLVPKVTENSVP